MKCNLIKLMGLYLFVSSCKSNLDRDKNAFAMNQEFVDQFNNEILIDSLAQRIVHQGDTAAYERLSSIFFLSEHDKELYFYATVMAENFNYSSASYDLYAILHRYSTNGQTTDSLANYYLLRAKEKGGKDLNAQIEEIFGKGNPVPLSTEYFKR